jgi:hypothetical protein
MAASKKSVKDKGGRPKRVPGTKAVPVNATPLLIAYLNVLAKKHRYGTTRAEVARNFVWKEVNRLIETNALQEIEPPEPAGEPPASPED